MRDRSEAEEERDATSLVPCNVHFFSVIQCSLLSLPLLYCQLCMPQKDVSGLGDPDLWPMTLTLELDLDNFSRDLHTKIQACMSGCSARIVRRTDTQTHTHRHTDNAKTITPSANAGCKNYMQCSSNVMRWKSWDEMKITITYIIQIDNKTIIVSIWLESSIIWLQSTRNASYGI